MANVAAHGAGQQGRREEFAMRRAPMRMQDDDLGCHFPAPQPHRVYCQPAAFHSVDGRDKHLMVVAYGASRPYSKPY